MLYDDSVRNDSGNLRNLYDGFVQRARRSRPGMRKISFLWQPCFSAYWWLLLEWWRFYSFRSCSEAWATVHRPFADRWYSELLFLCRLWYMWMRSTQFQEHTKFTELGPVTMYMICRHKGAPHDKSSFGASAEVWWIIERNEGACNCCRRLYNVFFYVYFTLTLDNLDSE